MRQKIKPIKEWNNVNKDSFYNDIIPSRQPAVLKGLMNHWPAVQQSKMSAQSIVEYLCSYDQGQTVLALVAPPEVKGRFDYQPDLKHFNFERVQQPLLQMLEDLLNLSAHPNPPAFSIQGLAVDENFTGFGKDNFQSLIDKTETARIWIGNKTTTRTHYDHVDNLACVVAGNRKFTLFPPKQLVNLYSGPLLSTPAGPPVSMVDLAEPDFERFPKFRQALESAEEAVLEPGDAIYIPYLWWHNVESLSNFNVLVNYWWSQIESKQETPYQCLIHSMLAFPSLPEYQRDIWRTFFDHYVFQLDGNPGEHLPDDVLDIVTKLTIEQKQKLRRLLAEPLMQ